MENKEIKITVPDGYEIDKENSTFECIKFKSKNLTYESIVKSLFAEGHYFISDNGAIEKEPNNCSVLYLNNATSEKQLEKLLAINKLMNVAKYLNGDWKPDWEDTTESKWCIEVNKSNEIWINFYISYFNMGIYFKTKELAQQAISILGKDTIRLALSTDW